MTALQTLKERGFLQSSTDEARLEKFLTSGTRSFYVGFDPTADSLHVGHLVPVMAMAWLARHGHKPIAIIGGGTARVGDPSGKDKTRTMLDDESITRNGEAFKVQLGHILNAGLRDSATPVDIILINNTN